MIVVMRKRVIYLVLAVFSMCALVSGVMYNSIHTNAVPVPGNVIVIDPGHGGRDPGALGHLGKHEKDINLDISKKLKTILEQNGYKVVLTRDEDESIHDEGAKRKKASEIKNRKKIIAEAGTKLVVSIHLNTFQQSKYYGAQVFYPMNSPESKRLAETIQSELKSHVDNSNDRKAKTITTAALLKGIQVPVVIVECGFLSNPEEERKLNSDEYQQKLAQAISSGVVKFISTPSIEQ